MIKVNSSLFKKSMGKFATGITVISINNKNKLIGKTVNSFTSLSLNPPLILFSLDRSSSSISEFKNSNFIGINILSSKQKKVSKHFSIKKPEWEGIKFFMNDDGIPIINDCLSNLNCKLIKTINQGDHVIFICKITKLLIDETKKPLVYFNSQYI